MTQRPPRRSDGPSAPSATTARVSTTSSSGCSAFTLVFFSTFAIYQGATGALGPRLLPREQYGQFCAASAILWHSACAAAIPLCGKFLDVFGYRYLFAWPAAWCAVGIGGMYLVYIDWQKLGGEDAYAAPLAAPQVATNEVGIVMKP